MAPDAERSTKNASKSKMLTMDVIELTLLLKSIGFRLESIDYDEFRCWNKKFNENAHGIATATAATRTDADQQHYINVEISCSKSKIVSNLSLKFNESDASVTDAHEMSDPTKIIACSCPKREPRNDNNSFWEVQSSGTFANPRRLSINALMNTEKGIDHDTSSNLLPVLSTKSIALTHVLTQVLLNQYKNNTPFGELSAIKDVDIKSIMRSVESNNAIDGKDAMPSAGQMVELNLITPSSSMNVTPTEPESLMNITVPKVTVNGQTNAALNETVNTEAFSSPKSDWITSSPHADQSIAQLNGRDAHVIDYLNAARQSIDQALLTIKLNVTRNLTQELPASLLTSAQQLPNDSNRNRPAPPPPPPSSFTRMLSGRNASQVSANARSSMTAMNRRASLGSIASIGGGRASLGSIGKVASPAIVSRFNMSKPNSVERPANSAAAAASKLSLVRRAVSGIGNRTIGSIATSVKTPNPTTALLKRPSSVSRRAASPSVPSTTTPTASAIRKTVSTAKTLMPSKLVRK